MFKNLKARRFVKLHTVAFCPSKFTTTADQSEEKNGMKIL